MNVKHYKLSRCSTVDRKRFAGLNIRGFNAMEVFRKYFHVALAISTHYFSINKERHLYSWKNIRGTPENHEKRESLAQ